VEGVEEREATEAFSPPGLQTEGTLSGVFTAERPTGETPAAAAAAALLAVMADTGLG